MADALTTVPDDILDSYRSLEVRRLDGSVVTGADLIAAEAEVCLEWFDGGWYEIELPPEVDLLAWREP